jgi:MFS transporter, YNFM family, putative membrane transport protein
LVLTDASATAPTRTIPPRAIVLLAGAAFSSSVNLRICDSLLPLIAAEHGVTIGRASVIVAAFTIGYGMLQLVFGPFGDRFGKYRVAALTSLAAGVATAASAASPSLDALMAARFVAGAFAAAAIPLAFAWIGDAVPFEGRQAVLARFLSAQIAGIVLGQAAGGVLADLVGWRAAFVLVGICHVLAGAAMLTELALNPAGQPAGSGRRLGVGHQSASALGLLARPWVRVMLAAVALEGFAFYGAFAYIGADLHHRMGLGLGLVGVVLATFGIGAIVYIASARRLVAWLGERGLVIAGGAVLAAGYVALAALPTAAVAPFVMAALGLGFYMIHNTLQTNATQMAPDARGLGVSLFAFALFVGQSAGVALAAPAVDAWGAWPVYLAAAVMLPAVAIWFRARLLDRRAQTG